jgi:hypothetical protein
LASFPRGEGFLARRDARVSLVAPEGCPFGPPFDHVPRFIPGVRDRRRAAGNDGPRSFNIDKNHRKTVV